MEQERRNAPYVLQNFSRDMMLSAHTATPNPRKLAHQEALDVLLTRLRYGSAAFKDVSNDAGSPHWLSAHVGDKVVHVFYMFNNDGGHLEDDKDLFPSDTLIAQLRLIRL